MRIDILTLFPEMFQGPFDASIVRRAREQGLVEIRLWNIRDFSESKHRVVDDAPYGGGAGLVMKPEPLFAAVEYLQGEGAQAGLAPARVLLMAPQGERFQQETARRLSRAEHLIVLCGHYEGIDDRVRQALVTDEISLGDFVLTGGELPAMVVVDAVTRLLPGALGDEASAEEESFEDGLLEYPHYTRPETFRGMAVPAVLLSGDHGKVREWRRKEALRRTLLRRPDLLERAPLTPDDFRLLEALVDELGLSS